MAHVSLSWSGSWLLLERWAKTFLWLVGCCRFLFFISIVSDHCYPLPSSQTYIHACARERPMRTRATTDVTPPCNYCRLEHHMFTKFQTGHSCSVLLKHISSDSETPTAEMYKRSRKKKKKKGFKICVRPTRISEHRPFLLFVGWLVGCLTSQQHAGVSQRRICLDNFTCAFSADAPARELLYELLPGLLRTSEFVRAAGFALCANDE